jgi:hypothetical protein
MWTGLHACSGNGASSGRSCYYSPRYRHYEAVSTPLVRLDAAVSLSTLIEDSPKLGNLNGYIGVFDHAARPHRGYYFLF